MPTEVQPDLAAEAGFPRFLADALTRHPEHNTTVDRAYAAWCLWANRQGGSTIPNRRWFTTQMRAHGLAAHTLRDSGVAVYVGWRLTGGYTPRSTGQS